MAGQPGEAPGQAGGGREAEQGFAVAAGAEGEQRAQRGRTPCDGLGGLGRTAGQGCHGRGVEEGAHGHVGAEFGADARGQARGRQGVAAEVEEAVVDADLGRVEGRVPRRRSHAASPPARFAGPSWRRVARRGRAAPGGPACRWPCGGGPRPWRTSRGPCGPGARGRGGPGGRRRTRRRLPAAPIRPGRRTRPAVSRRARPPVPSPPRRRRPDGRRVRPRSRPVRHGSRGASPAGRPCPGSAGHRRGRASRGRPSGTGVPPGRRTGRRRTARP